MIDGTDARGVDWDLRACLAENPQSFTVDDIARVLAEVAGDEDRPWWWLLELRDGRPALLRGDLGRAGWRDRSRAASAAASAPYADWYCGAACDRFSAAHPEGVPLDVVTGLARQERQGRERTRREIVGAALARDTVLVRHEGGPYAGQVRAIPAEIAGGRAALPGAYAVREPSVAPAPVDAPPAEAAPLRWIVGDYVLWTDGDGGHWYRWRPRGGAGEGADGEG